MALSREREGVPVEDDVTTAMPPFPVFELDALPHYREIDVKNHVASAGPSRKKQPDGVERRFSSPSLGRTLRATVSWRRRPLRAPLPSLEQPE